MKVALATSSDHPELASQEQPLIPALAAIGIEGIPRVWSDVSERWDDVDAVIIRSCWDYHRQHDRFVEWIMRLSRERVALWNPPSLVTWNSDKRYLRDLESKGVSIVPTVWTDESGDASLESILIRHDWREAVVKPAISASGYETRRIQRSDADEMEAWFGAMRSRSPMLVQPLLHEVIRDGELSLVFLNGQFSHAALKRPREGDFRVHVEHGGSSVIQDEVPIGAIETARDILAKVDGDWLYARVDGCIVDGAFVLMELEMVEPSLFLELDADVARRFAEAIRARLR